MDILIFAEKTAQTLLFSSHRARARIGSFRVRGSSAWPANASAGLIRWAFHLQSIHEEIDMNRKWRSRTLLGFGFSAMMCVTLAIPVLAMGPAPPPPAQNCETLVVPCIEWALTGGRGQHIHVQAFVQNELGEPVLDAVVSMSARRDGAEYNVVGGSTGSYDGLDGGVDCPGGPPGSGITSDFCVNSAPVGFYDAVVLSVTKEGCGDWDGVTPSNGNDFQGKQ
jgi:hypothetical protein